MSKLKCEWSQARRSGPAVPEKVRSSFTANLVWFPPFDLDRFTGRGRNALETYPHKGIYFVYRSSGNLPLYVGIAWSRSIGRRWAHRIRVLEELGIDRPGVKVAVARVPGSSGLKDPDRKDLFESIERVMVRYFWNKAKQYGNPRLRLRNKVFNKDGSGFTVGPGDVHIRHLGAIPAVLDPSWFRFSRGSRVPELT